MGEVRKFLTVEYVKENMQLFPLLIIGFYSIGFIRLKGYYQAFGIQIENYVSINDLVFQSIYIFLLIVVFLFIFFVVIMIFKYLTRNFQFNNLVIWFMLSLQTTLLIIYFISSFIDFEGSQFLIYAMMVLFIYMIYYEKDYDRFLNFYSLKPFVINILIILFFIIGVFGHGLRDGLKNKDFKKEGNISFVYEGDLYSTLHPSLNLIGETSEYIFLFQTVSNRSLVFRKDDIKSLQYILKNS